MTEPNITDWRVKDGPPGTDTVDGIPSSADRHILSGIGDAINSDSKAKMARDRIRDRVLGEMNKELELTHNKKVIIGLNRAKIQEMITWSTYFVIEQFKNQLSSLLGGDKDNDKTLWERFKEKRNNLYITADIFLSEVVRSNKQLPDHTRLTTFELVKSFMSAMKDYFIQMIMQTNLYRDCLRMLERHGLYGTVVKIALYGLAAAVVYKWFIKPSKLAPNV